MSVDVMLNDAECQRAWAEGEARQRAAHTARASTHGDNRQDYITQAWYHVQGRAAELALCRWLGVIAPPDSDYYGEQSGHFDTPPPWAVQVKSTGSVRAGLTIGLSKRHCWRCPYVLAYVLDVCLVRLVGWAPAAQVRTEGYQVTWARGGRSIILQRELLRPLPSEDVQAKGWHRGAPLCWQRGEHSLCPHGRT